MRSSPTPGAAASSALDVATGRVARPRQAAGLGAPPHDRPYGAPAVGRPRLGLRARRGRRRRRDCGTRRDADARLRRARRRRRARRAALGDRRSRARELAVGAAVHAADAAPQHVTFGDGKAFVTSGDAGVLRVQDARRAERCARRRFPIGSYNVQYGFGRVITAVARPWHADGARRRGAAARARAGRRAPATTPVSAPDLTALRKPYRFPGGSFRAVGNMAPMKRLLLLAVLVVAATAIPAQASAAGAVPQRDLQRLGPGRQDRLDVPDLVLPRCDQSRARRRADLLEPDDDIRAAMQAAISRAHGKSKVAEPGRQGFPASETVLGSGLDEQQRRDERAGRTRRRLDDRVPTRRRQQRRQWCPGAVCSCSVVLRSLLAAAGGVGMLARRRGATTSPSCRAARGA